MKRGRWLGVRRARLDSIVAVGALVACVAIATLLAPALPAHAQGLRDDPLPRDGWVIDLLLRTTDHPDLLTSREALLRQWLLDRGIDPLNQTERVSTASLSLRWLADGAGQALFTPPREVEILEPWGDDRVVLYRYPETFLFYSNVDTNLVGVGFEAPRPVDSDSVRVQLVTTKGWLRTWTTIAINDTWGRSLRKRVAEAASGDGMLNFTVPIRLPRTLEQIIGRGDATNIRISGRESISISGTSTVQDNFQGNEVRQTQSLFPTLEMRQSLQVNLDGQVGEKIKVRVSHDSEAIGNQSTQVRLSFEGDEDDIIRTIRAGDIDLTLPGSQLLGIPQLRGGLFGLKIEGALGGLNFTLLTSKEESQQSKRNFSAQGGVATPFEIPATDYVKSRIFRFTAPAPLFFEQGDTVRVAGEAAGVVPFDLRDDSGLYFNPTNQGGRGWRIDPNSVELYVSVVGAGAGSARGEDLLDLVEGRAYVDPTGVGWSFNGADPDPDGLPNFAGLAFVASPVWRRLAFDDWEFILDDDTGAPFAIILGFEVPDNVSLAVTYNAVDPAANNQIVSRVGRPWFNEGEEPIPNPDSPGETMYYFKLMKPTSQGAPEPLLATYGTGFDLTWEYMFRNFYSLRAQDVDASTVDVSIARNNNEPNSDWDFSREPQRRWLHLFGLDSEDPSGNPVVGGDGVVDNRANLIFSRQGLLAFPDFTPFDQDTIVTQANLRSPDIYTKKLTSTAVFENQQFLLRVVTTSTSARLSLNTFNIKDGSEEVRLDGGLLQRGSDYEIDYFSGEITLTGAANRLNAQSNITVDFEVDPLFGGGRTSLSGFNLGYRLGTNKTLSTTWLLQSKPTANRKPRLGEEPSRNWVGNFAAKLQFQPKLVRGIANILPLVSDTNPTPLNVDAEIALSLPNPNTAEDGYIEDFEAVDVSDVVPLGREGWLWAGLPAEHDETSGDREFGPDDRAYIRWYRPSPGVQRGDLNPTLSDVEKRDIVPALQWRMDAAPANPDSTSSNWWQGQYTGIQRGYAADLDLTEAQFFEFWVNDFQPQPGLREGKLHIDFGFIVEDVWWNDDGSGDYEFSAFDKEDRDNDFRVSDIEDTGFDGKRDSEFFLENQLGIDLETGPIEPPFDGVSQSSSDPAGDTFDAQRGSDDEENQYGPFPRINGLENNRRADTEDLNRNGALDTSDGYFTLTLDLADTDRDVLLVDVNEDYSQERRDPSFAWRKYRLDMRNLEIREANANDQTAYRYFRRNPDLAKIQHVRIWYELPNGSTSRVKELQFAEMRFLGNRWVNDGVHDSDTHVRQNIVEASPAEFRVGVMNNKENPDYVPPVFPDTRNNVAEKEQSLELSYSDLGPGQEIRVRREIPGSQGQDWIQLYNQLKYFWRTPVDGANMPDSDQLFLEPFFWVGTDSTNYYELSFAFDDVGYDANGWKQIIVPLDQITNTKRSGDFITLPDGTPAIRGTIDDMESTDVYTLTIVGRPDLRRVRRLYAGVRYPSNRDPLGQQTGPRVSGSVLFNEILLSQVNRQIGIATRVGSTLQIPGLGDIALDWRQQDAEFHGLNRDAGTGSLDRSWGVRASSRVQSILPTFGFDIPVTYTTSKSRSEPKFLPDSDVVLFQQSVIDSLTTTDDRESYSWQVRKRTTSRNPLIGFTLDRLSYSFNRTTSERRGPRVDTFRESDESRYNYDLNIPGANSFKLPIFGSQIRYLPNQITLGSTWSRDENLSINKFENGDVDSTRTLTRTIRNNGSIAYSPLREMRATWTLGSVRDRDRTRDNGTDDFFLFNHWGLENTHTERLNVTYAPRLPIVRWFVTDATYNGSYSEDLRPGVRRPANPNVGREQDPESIRNMSNSTDVSLRGELALGGVFQTILGTGKPKPKDTGPTAVDRREPGRIDRNRRRATTPTPQPSPPPGTAATDTTATGQPPGFPPITPAPGDTTGVGGEVTPQGTPPPPPLPPPTDEDDTESDDSDTTSVRLNPAKAIGNLVRPVLTVFRELQPIRANYTFKRNTSYGHISSRAGWGYRLGALSFPDVGEADSLQSGTNQSRTHRINISTQTRLTENIRIDLSLDQDFTQRSGSSTGISEDESRQFPVVTVNFQNVHRWAIFGNIFAGSTLDLTWREQTSRRGKTANSEGTPTATSTISPRWNFRFGNGLSGNINVSSTRTTTTSAGKDNKNQRLSVALTLQKAFDADGFLGFLRFGRRGTGSTIDMNVDLGYDRNKSSRVTTEGREDQVQGNTILFARPRFSYQFSRNLRAGLNLEFSRRSDLGNTQIGSTSFGLGFDATLTF